MYLDFIAKGTSDDVIHYLPLEGHSHSSGIIPSGLASLLWFYEIRDGGSTILP
jgi:hypothetical protein